MDQKIIYKTKNLNFKSTYNINSNILILEKQKDKQNRVKLIQ